MFIKLDMAPRREPPFGVLVVDQEDLLPIGVDEHAVGHKMLGRRRWLRGAKDLGDAVEPIERIKPMVGFRAIDRNDLVDEGADLCSHPSHPASPSREQRPSRLSPVGGIQFSVLADTTSQASRRRRPAAQRAHPRAPAWRHYDSRVERDPIRAMSYPTRP